MAERKRRKKASGGKLPYAADEVTLPADFVQRVIEDRAGGKSAAGDWAVALRVYALCSFLDGGQAQPDATRLAEALGEDEEAVYDAVALLAYLGMFGAADLKNLYGTG